MDNHTEAVSYHLPSYVPVFSQNDWEDLDSIVNNIFTKGHEILETPQSGDSRNEYVDLAVARFIIRKNGQSKIVNQPYSSKILDILTRANFISAVEQHTKLKDLKILRMQLNSMKKNSFVGVHTDKESDAAYQVTVLIRTTSFYSGGELCIYYDKAQIINQENRSVFLMDPCIEHEVKTVTDGYRNSLVILLGKAD